MNEQDKTLPWFKWFTKDVKNYREVFNNEQMGELFFAVMKTVESNERVEVSKEIKFPYLQLCTTVAEVREAYLKKCETNAINGAKGGKAKAANTKAETKGNEFKPPSKTEFRTMATHIVKTYDLDCDAYEIDNAFDFYNNKNWTFGDIPITNKNQLECAAFTHLSENIASIRIFRQALMKKYEISLDVLTDLALCYKPNQDRYLCDDKLFKNEADLLDYVYNDTEE